MLRSWSKKAKTVESFAAAVSRRASSRQAAYGILNSAKSCLACSASSIGYHLHQPIVKGQRTLYHIFFHLDSCRSRVSNALLCLQSAVLRLLRNIISLYFRERYICCRKGYLRIPAHGSGTVGPGLPCHCSVNPHHRDGHRS